MTLLPRDITSSCLAVSNNCCLHGAQKWLFMFGLVSATVPQVTFSISLGVLAVKAKHIERAAVSHLNFNGPLATIWSTAKVHIPGYSAFRPM